MNKSIKFCRLILVLLAICSGVLVTSCEQPNLPNEDNTEQDENNNGEDQNEGSQENSKAVVTLNLKNVTAATAAFSGHLNVPSSDLPFSQVTVYYSDAEPFNINSAESVSVTSYDKGKDFTVILTNLQYNTKYSYCMLAELKSEKIYGDVLNFTTDDIAISELIVTPKSFKAEVYGKITGLSKEDLEYIDVGILYSNNSTYVENRVGEKVQSNLTNTDGTFSITLSDLSLETKYYYCGYISQGLIYDFYPVKEFITLQHPYMLTSDLNISAARDLSSLASANCYIVSESGLYKFKTVKGNGDEPIGGVSSASILWETYGNDVTPLPIDLIEAVCYKDGYLAFQTAEVFKEGNAVIAVKDEFDNILWSWHIWFTDPPMGQLYKNDAGTMMDRNLGATSITPGDVGALGLLYQWGRKDPFLGASSIDTGKRAKSTIDWPSPVVSDPRTGTIDFTICYPTTFVASDGSQKDWYYTDDRTPNNTLWGTSETVKSIYDPCPSGWRIPDGGTDGIWYKAGFDDITFDSTNRGMSFSISSPYYTWYPAAGYLIDYSGKLENVAYRGRYWSASTTGRYSYFLTIIYGGGVYPLTYSEGGRASAHSVRCIQESK